MSVRACKPVGRVKLADSFRFRGDSVVDKKESVDRVSKNPTYRTAHPFLIKETTSIQLRNVGPKSSRGRSNVLANIPAIACYKRFSCNLLNQPLLYSSSALFKKFTGYHERIANAACAGPDMPEKIEPPRFPQSD